MEEIYRNNLSSKSKNKSPNGKYKYLKKKKYEIKFEKVIYFLLN